MECAYYVCCFPENTMSAFHDLCKQVMRATRLNPDYFAESVEYRSGDDVLAIDVAARHELKIDRDPDTNDETVIEHLHVEIDRDDLTAAPTYGDRLYRAGDSDAYLYQYQGRVTPHSYKATFARRRQTAAGVG